MQAPIRIRVADRFDNTAEQGTATNLTFGLCLLGRGGKKEDEGAAKARKKGDVVADQQVAKTAAKLAKDRENMESMRVDPK